MEVRREVSVKVGGPTRSSFLFSNLRGLLTRAARNSSLDPWAGIHLGRNVVIIPDGGAAKIAGESRLFSRVELTFCQIYDACIAVQDNGGDIDYGRGANITFFSII